MGDRRNIRRSKSRESPTRPLPDFVQKLADHSLSESNSDDDISQNLHFVSEEHSTRELMEYDHTSISKSGGRKKKRNKKKTLSIPSDVDNLSDNDPTSDDLNDILNDLITSCKAGNHKLLNDTIVIFQDLIFSDKVTVKHKDIKSVPDLLNKGFGETTTALHIATQY